MVHSATLRTLCLRSYFGVPMQVCGIRLSLYFKSVYRYRALIMRVFDKRFASAKI